MFFHFSKIDINFVNDDDDDVHEIAETINSALTL